MENPLWGAPRIHAELLKLGFEVAQSSVAKYMVKRRGPPSQGWRTFLRNHAPNIAAMDLFVVPTIGFDLLYAFVIVRLGRRDLVWINVSTNPTAEWIARQLTEAFPWSATPRYLIRDRDRIYGSIVARRMRAMGIRDKPTAPASPWQNGCARTADRINSTRVRGPFHCLRRGASTHILRTYAHYYNDIRTHRSLDKDAPVSRPVQRIGSVNSHAILGGLHHHYVRIYPTTCVRNLPRQTMARSVHYESGLESDYDYLLRIAPCGPVTTNSAHRNSEPCSGVPVPSPATNSTCRFDGSRSTSRLLGKDPHILR